MSNCGILVMRGNATFSRSWDYEPWRSFEQVIERAITSPRRGLPILPADRDRIHDPGVLESLVTRQYWWGRNAGNP